MKPRELVKERLEEFARPISECNLIDGIMLTDIAVAHAAQFDIEHGLGRIPEGYIITKAVTDCVGIREISSTTTTATLYPLLFLGGGNATIDLWVF